MPFNICLLASSCPKKYDTCSGDPTAPNRYYDCEAPISPGAEQAMSQPPLTLFIHTIAILTPTSFDKPQAVLINAGLIIIKHTLLSPLMPGNKNKNLIYLQLSLFSHS